MPRQVEMPKPGIFSNIAWNALRSNLSAVNSEAATTLAARMQQVLVIADRDSELPKLGLMIDAVLGLVDATGRVHPGAASSAVIERRSIDGRVVSVLDPRALVARARSAIEDMAA